jgi:hypothetical protein
MAAAMLSEALSRLANAVMLLIMYPSFLACLFKKNFSCANQKSVGT